MKSNNDFMVKIHTLGLLPTSVVVQIAGVKYNIETKEITDEFLVNIDPFDSKKYGFTVDPSTVEWWKTQPSQLVKGWKKDAQPLREAIYQFNHWCDPNNSTKSHMTAFSTGFDLPPIKYACHQVGVDLPWKNYLERDLRTIIEIYGDKFEKQDERFNALDDCYAQTELLFRVFS